MTRWSFDAENNSGVLTIEGDMTIHHVVDLKDRLVEAFDKAERVTIDVSSAPAVDVAGVQLLCACQRFSIGRGKSMCLRLGGNTRFAQFLSDVGLAQDFICDHGKENECFWTSAS
jgi:anti-anti-sigma regulatory factor